MEPLSYKEQIKKVNASNPFMVHNGIRAVALDGESARVEAAIGPASLNAMGGVHGGLMMAAAEIAAGLITRSDGRRYVTLDSSFRFIKGSRTRDGVEARAVLVKRGRTICFAHARVVEKGSEALLGEGDFTFYCLDGDEKPAEAPAPARPEQESQAPAKAQQAPVPAGRDREAPSLGGKYRPTAALPTPEELAELEPGRSQSLEEILKALEK